MSTGDVPHSVLEWKVTLASPGSGMETDSMNKTPSWGLTIDLLNKENVSCLCLSLSAYLLSMSISRSIHVATDGIISFLFMVE